MSKKTIIGITGRTGSGKSHACSWINAHIDSVEHLDCDEIGHEILKENPIKKQLFDIFGNDINENDTINRKKLGQIVFNNKEQLFKLNDIVHPKICEIVKKRIDTTSKKVIIIEGALIHQVGLEHVCNHTICIDSPTTSILKRRPDKDIILTKQPKANDYINMCTHTIKNNANIERFEEKIQQLFERLQLI